jgi:hypothetical protein
MIVCCLIRAISHLGKGTGDNAMMIIGENLKNWEKHLL